MELENVILKLSSKAESENSTRESRSTIHSEIIATLVACGEKLQ